MERRRELQLRNLSPAAGLSDARAKLLHFPPGDRAEEKGEVVEPVDFRHKLRRWRVAQVRQIRLDLARLARENLILRENLRSAAVPRDLAGDREVRGAALRPPTEETGR